MAVGVISHLSDADQVSSTHRGHGHMVAKGGGLKLMFAELFGRATGYCRGRGGSIHVSDLGAAACGLRPVVDLMFMDFIGVAMDQIYDQAAKIKYMFGGKVTLPLTITTLAGGGLSAAAQHSQSLESWLCHVPGLKVTMPSTPYDMKGFVGSGHPG